MPNEDEEEVAAEMKSARWNTGAEVSRTTIDATVSYKDGFYFVLPHRPLKLTSFDAQRILLSLVKD